MKKALAVAGFLVLCMAIVGFYTGPALASDDVSDDASDGIKFYVEGEVGGSFVNLDSGGYNTFGGFPNTGDDWDTTVVPGVRVGVKFLDFLRADIGFNYRSELNFTTNSLVPIATYATEVDDSYTLMLSLFFEPVELGKFTPYIGAGIGSAWVKGYTMDSVVHGNGSDTNLAWQAEAGMQYDLTEQFTLKLGYRYVDMGTLDINLSHMGLGTPAGNFTGDLTSHEALFGLRYSF